MYHPISNDTRHPMYAKGDNGKSETTTPTINDLFIKNRYIELTIAPNTLTAHKGGGDFEPPYITGTIAAMLTARDRTGTPVALVPISIRVETGGIDWDAAADISCGVMDLILCNPAQTDFEP